MVSRAAPALTKIGFRRDVRYFLAALVGFLVVLILALAIVLELTVSRIELASRDRWNAQADLIAMRLQGTPLPVALPQLDTLRAENHLAAIEAGGVRSGYAPDDAAAVTRGDATMWFDAAAVNASRRLARMTIAISTGAAGVGILALFLFLPRITRPIEQMLDEARSISDQGGNVDEARYLVETFRSTIETMKRQAVELEQLHEAERTRANELELLTATLTRSLTSGFVALDRGGAVVDMNRAAREILHLDGEVAGRRIEQLLPATRFAEVVADAFANRRTLSRMEIEDGESIIGLTTVPLLSVALAGEADAFIGLMVLFTDVTHVRRLELRLRDQQALASLGEMSAGIAHEFRNALSTILGYLRLATRQTLPDEAVARIRAAEREASLLSGAVDSLLSFARPMRLERGSIELHELLESAIVRMQELQPLPIHLEGAAVEVTGDAAALRTAFENLLRNAAESLSRKGAGAIHVALHREADVRVVIRDEGIGLDPADVPRLFVPFQSDRPDGIGLGLPLARKIVLLHGGTLEMTGVPGEGATVTVTLPLQSDVAAGAKSDSSGPNDHSPIEAIPRKIRA
ncbi:MAG TPA: ATP-binding protein [Thermoanaerobaculia bacterium]|jgi:signal transduction histidine kinase